MNTLLEFRQPGETFEFLGGKFIVTQLDDNKALNKDFEEEGFDTDFAPDMVAMYRDGDGIIREQRFTQNELPALKAENADTGPIRTLAATIRDELLEANKKVSFSMQKGYVDGVDELFNEINRRLAQ